MVTEHVSMATQWDPVLRLQDCLQTFSQKYNHYIVTVVMVTCFVM